MKVRKHNATLKKLWLISIAVLLTFSVVELSSQTSLEMESFIVQGDNVDEVANLVEDYGGSITSRLELINGVAALLPRSVAVLCWDSSCSCWTGTGNILCHWALQRIPARGASKGTNFGF